MNILFIGDIVGKAGRRITARKIADLIDHYSAEFVIANIENAAAGFGITPKIADDLLSMNIDCLTSGNHIFDRKEIIPYLSKQANLLRPLNYPEPVPGSGIFIGTAKNGARVAVLNVLGRVFLNTINCPFTSTDEALKMIHGKSDVIIIDFHAEATSEKMAFGWYVDGRASAVIGTHTHVQTADERILPEGTAYITDVGMTGPFDSVIGIEKELAISKFLTQRPIKFETANNNIKLQAVLLSIDDKTGKAQNIHTLTINEEQSIYERQPD
jgi:metallophosphoesterase (TIGR00282 family)